MWFALLHLKPIYWWYFLYFQISRYIIKNELIIYPNRFCYICEHVVLLQPRAEITNFVKKTYDHAYFGLKITHHLKPFAPKICCKTCVENLLDWSNKKRKSMSFGSPMMWREGKDHTTECYSCLTNLKGWYRKDKQHVKYPHVPSITNRYRISPTCLFLNQMSP